MSEAGGDDLVMGGLEALTHRTVRKLLETAGLKNGSKKEEGASEFGLWINHVINFRLKCIILKSHVIKNAIKMKKSMRGNFFLF